MNGMTENLIPVQFPVKDLLLKLEYKTVVEVLRAGSEPAISRYPR